MGLSRLAAPPIRRSCLVLTLVSSAAFSAPLPVRTADEMIARHLEARGGAARLKAVRTVRFTGTLKAGPSVVQMEILKKRPAFFRVTLRADDAIDGGGFDGAAWELQDGVPRRVEGAAAQSLRQAAEFEESFIDYKTKGNTVELAGTRSVDGRECPALRVTLADGMVREYYFDPGTFLIAADRKGTDGARLTLRQDYRRVEGVLVPFAAVERDTGAGSVVSEVHWDRIDVNVPLDDAAFGPQAP
jgi:hypothetical protein